MLLKELLRDTVCDWDQEGTPRNVRETFWKIVNCGTEALGAEVYSSDTSKRILYHTCKSTFCPSCGSRSSTIWKEQIGAMLPTVPYTEINFTMPKVFWPIVNRNRRLLRKLPALAGNAIDFWARARWRSRVILMVVQQTYGGFLNFYPHLHMLVSAGGLDDIGRWNADLGSYRLDHKHDLMLAWRLALLTALASANENGTLETDQSREDFKKILQEEGSRTWNVYVGRLVSKETVIDHIGRYIRRPPIAQYRLTRIDRDHVKYLAKDTRNGRMQPMVYTNRGFVNLLAPHVNDRYCNSMHYFGLLAPRSKILLAHVFSVLGQEQKPQPVRLTYAQSIQKTFGRNPLIGSDGEPLRLTGRIRPLGIRSELCKESTKIASDHSG